MATYTIDQLTTPLTADEIKTAIYTAIATSGVTTTNWKPGAVTRTIIAAVAIVCAALSLLISKLARGGYLEYAAGPWLQLLAKQQFNVDFIDATFASGTVLLTNSGGGIYNLVPDELVLTNSVTGKTYRNTAAVSIGALVANVPCAIAAIEAGSASTALPGEIVATSITNITATQTTALVGADAEEDPALQARCAEKLGSLSPNGPADAYAYIAKTAKRVDGSPVNVTRVRTVKDGNGNVDVYCATDSGAVPGDANNPATDLGAVNEAIQRLATPLAVTARVYSATPVVVPVTYEVWLYKTSALTEQQIKDAIAAELATYFKGQAIGGNVIAGYSGKLYADAITGVIGRARHSSGALLGIFRTVLVEPAADVTLGISHVPVLGAVSPVAINQIAAPSGSVVI